MLHSLLPRSAHLVGWLLPWVGISAEFVVGWGGVQALFKSLCFLPQINPRTARDTAFSRFPQQRAPTPLLSMVPPPWPLNTDTEVQWPWLPPTYTHTAWADSTTPPKKKGPRQGRGEKDQEGPGILHREDTWLFLGLMGSASMAQRCHHFPTWVALGPFSPELEIQRGDC